MKLQSIKPAPFILALALTLPSLAMAQAFPCNQAGACEQTPNLQVELQAEQQAHGGITGLAADGNKQLFMRGIALTDEQRNAITQVIESQMPTIIAKSKSLESAHAMLREMAVNRQYNETLANALGQTIADNSAALALLQAEREYQVYAILTPEQARQFDQMKELSTTQKTQ